MPIQYEHHIAIRQNPLCPFFLRVVHDLCDTVCNWHRNPELLLVTGGEGFVRASYCYSIDHIHEALRRTKEFLDELK